MIAAATREALLQVASCNIANALLKRGLRNVCLLGLSALSPERARLVGEAYTLRFIPAREDIDTLANYARSDNLHRRAIEECPAGAVLVIDAGGSTRAASAGDMMAARLKARGVAGIVTDGGYRDTDGIRATGLPAWQRTTAPPATPLALHPVELNGPVGCAGVAVYPGDVIVGDADGVVAIPRALADEVAAEALADAHYEAWAEQQIARGRSLFGLFPATADSRAEYEQWVAAGRPTLETMS